MHLPFSVAAWAAWAPGLTTPEAWTEWARLGHRAPVGADTPPLTEVPAMARRRIEKMGRLAYQVATWVQGEAKGEPLVFASRHGDANRSVELLVSLAKHEPLSPTSFAISVHNAIGAQYSIQRKDTSNVVAVANGPFTVEAAVTEAMVLLGEAGTEHVTMVVYDASPSSFFAPYYDEPEADYAWAWRLKKGADFSLETLPAGPITPRSTQPHALEVLRFFLDGSPSLERVDETAGWKWSRRA